MAAGTIYSTFLLAIMCAILSTVCCRSLFTPNLDQLATEETNGQRFRRDGPGAVPGSIIKDQNYDQRVEDLLKDPTTSGTANKPLCDQTVEANKWTRCNLSPKIFVKWTPNDKKARILVEDRELTKI